jgi:hypothetical protein
MSEAEFGIAVKSCALRAISELYNPSFKVDGQKPLDYAIENCTYPIIKFFLDKEPIDDRRVIFDTLKTMGKIPNTSSSKFIAKGSYGCILHPALPNLNNSGRLRPYNRNVTKLFETRVNRNKALANSQKMSAITHDPISYRAEPYRFNYNKSFLSPELLSHCTSRANDKLYPMRLPYLGVSIQSLTVENITAIKRIPIEVIISQIVKLFHHIDNILDAGYIHGDINLSNVMINIETGIISLIDFDWLFTFDDFYSGYSTSFGFYSNPPESLVLTYRVRPSEYVTVGNAYLDNNESSIWVPLGIDYNDLETTISFLVNANTSVNPRTFFRSMIPTFDSYAIAIVLVKLINKVYGIHTLPDSPLKSIVFGVMVPMISFDMRRRIGIKEAIHRVEQILAPSASAAGASSGGRRSTRRQSRHRNRAKK